MYGGHARYGSGPDFDHKDSADGNFVIGTPYDSHMAEIIRGKQNQLKVVKMKDDYQMMFFSACTSLNYRDELRSMLPNKNAENLDLIMSNKELYWNVTSENLLAVLDGVLGQQSKKDMEAKLQALNNNAGFTFDGFA